MALANGRDDAPSGAAVKRFSPFVLAGLLLLELSFLVHLNREVLARQADALEADSWINTEYEEVGELLIHRLPPLWSNSVSERMPVLSMAEASLLNRSKTSRRAWMCIVWLAQLALLAFLCSFLGPWYCAPIAVAVFAWAGYGTFDNNASVQVFYALPVTLAAAAIAWREQKPGVIRSWTAGFCLGFTFLCRSTLIFLPLVLGVAAIMRRRKTAKRDLRMQLFGLCILPYLFLLPWVGMNWSLHGKFMPLEDHESDSVVIAGALGIAEPTNIESITGPRAAADIQTGGVLLWAAGEVVKHPVRYAISCWERFCLIFGWQPLLFSLAAAACFMRRKERPESLALGLFCFYFVGIHCLMAVRREYFMPLLPIMVAAVSLLAPAAPRPAGRLAAVAFGAFMCLMGGTALYAYGKSAAYGSQDWLAADLSDHLESEIRRSPDDGWLRFYRGRASPGGKERANDFARAAEASPRHPGRKAFLSSAESAVPLQTFGVRQIEEAVRTGDRPRALRLLDAAAAASLPGVLNSRIALAYQELGLHGRSIEILDSLLAGSPSNGAFWEQRGIALRLAGKETEAIRDLKRSIALSGSPSAYLSLGALHADRKEWREARITYQEGLRSSRGKQDPLVPVIVAALNGLPKER